MVFRFKSSDFDLCDCEKSHAIELRNRFLELYNELTPKLKEDSHLNRFITYRNSIRNGLKTISPYVSKYHNRWGKYRNCWIGFAEKKYENPRNGIQFQFGIDKDGSNIYGISIMNDVRTRPTQHELYQILRKNNFEVIAATLRKFGSKYYLFVERYEDGKYIVNKNCDLIIDTDIRLFMKNLEKKRLWIELSKKLTEKELCLLHNPVEDILRTTHHLLPIYLWWSGCKPRKMLEEEYLKVLESGDEKSIDRFMKIPDGDGKAYVDTRTGQNAIRRYALKRYNNQCSLCDIKIKELLVASHITLWSKDEKNRRNPRNVICLCAVHDKMFEKGLLYIEDNYKVHFSKQCLEMQNSSKMFDLLCKNTNEYLRLPKIWEPDPILLRRHRRKFYNS